MVSPDSLSSPTMCQSPSSLSPATRKRKQPSYSGDEASSTEGDESDMEIAAGDRAALGEHNSRLQKKFEDNMQDFARKRSHKRVAVLLISWEVKGEDSLDTTDEVRRLKQTFEDDYRFTVSHEILLIEEGRQARHQLDFFLSKFIYKADSENSLLIVYYAGHGRPSTKQKDIWLEGGNPQPGRKKMMRTAWKDAESQLDRADADKLVIFDCCHAGILARKSRSTSSDKIFEYIGSTTAEKTAVGPGDDSFTSALIWSLKELSCKEAGFTTLQLRDKIAEAPIFRDIGQHPVCSERGEKQSLYKLKITPLPAQQSPTDSIKVTSQKEELGTQFYLDLQFRFKKLPSDRHVSRLTRSLCNLADELPLNQVSWKCLTDENTEMQKMRKWAARWKNKKNRTSLSRKLKVPRLQAPTVNGALETPATTPLPQSSEKDLI